MELLGNDGFGWIGADPRLRRSFQQSRIAGIGWRRLDGVAESDIDAHLYSGAANPGPEVATNRGVLGVLSKWFYVQRLDIENDSIVDNRYHANGADGRADAALPGVSVTSKVEIPGGTVGRLTPQSEQHRSLQNKVASILGLAKAVQESLGRVSLEQELEVLFRCTAPVQQSGADRCGDVSEWLASHETSAACRYALTTDRARQASAARMISSTVATRRRNASCRASSATSRPTLLR